MYKSTANVLHTHYVVINEVDDQLLVALVLFFAISVINLGSLPIPLGRVEAFYLCKTRLFSSFVLHLLSGE